MFYCPALFVQPRLQLISERDDQYIFFSQHSRKPHPMFEYANFYQIKNVGRESKTRNPLKPGSLSNMIVPLCLYIIIPNSSLSTESAVARMRLGLLEKM